MSESLPSLDSADLPLQEDLPCMRCGYDLRTHRPSDLCPECGLPVRQSIEDYRNRPVFPHLVLSALGILLLSIGFAVACVTVVLAFLLPPWRGLAASSADALIHVAFITVAAALLFSSIRGARAGPRTLVALLRITLVTYIVTTAGAAVFNLLLYAAISPTSPRFAWTLGMPYWFRMGFPSLANVFLGMLYALAVPACWRICVAVRARSLGAILVPLLAILAAIHFASTFLLAFQLWVSHARYSLAPWYFWRLRSALRLAAATCDAGLAVGSFLLAFRLLLPTLSREEKRPASPR